jgi:ankyrin repeat protein
MSFKNLFAGVFITALLSSAAGDARLADAAEQDDRSAVRDLLNQKEDVNKAQGDGMTALHWAASNDDLAMVQLLLNAGANVKAETRLGAVTPLFMACKSGNASIVEALLKAGASASAPDAHGTTPLMMAAAAGGAEAVKVLLDHGADVNAKETSHGQTALMFAAAFDRDAAIKVLMAHGADAKITSKAVDPGCGSVFDVNGCVETDENGDPVDENGKPLPKEKESEKGKEKADGQPASPESKAASSAKVEPDGNAAGTPAPDSATQVADLQAQVQKLTARIDELEKHPAAKPKKSKDAAADKNVAAAAKKKKERRGATVMGGMTALLFAARDGQMEAARALLEAGADVNDAGAGEKMTPLVLAISNGHYDLGKYLLDHGADPKLAGESGLTALYATIDMQWAPYAWYPQPITVQEKTSYLDLMKALMEHGADPNARLKKQVWFRALPDNSTWVDAAGATPFWRAAQSDDLAAMRLLVEHGASPWLATTQGDTPLMVAVGLGWALNFSRNAPDSWMAAAKYCIDLDSDVNAVDEKGYTALDGAAFRGDNEMVQFLVKNGAKVDVKTKKGDTVADFANGPFHHSIPHPETIALLEKLGSKSSNNCRSDQCVPQIEEGKKVAVADASASAKPAPKTAPKQ